jgi:ribosomal protein S18 acetylase RimI-like enzyme
MAGPAVAPALIVEANLREAMRAYSAVTPEGESRDYPGVTIASSGLDFSVFNSLMLTSAVESERELDQRITTGAVHFAARGIGWTAWLCDDLLAPAVLKRAGTLLGKRGIHTIAEPPGMLAERIAPANRRPAPVECCRVSSSKTRFDFADVASVVFLLPFRVSQAAYAGEEYWSCGMRGYVGYFAGKPVSVVSTVLAGGAVGVYSLGTLPQHQRCGYGETLLRFALADTTRATGVERTVLQSTQSGFRLYQRMGYRTVTRFRIHDCSACGLAK